MCGRYTLHAKTGTIEKALGVEFPSPLEPDYNIGPGREVSCVRKQTNGSLLAGPAHWGLRTPRNFIINARLETADQIHRFRESWTANRCLLPANGFYEWLRKDGRKEPYYFRHESGELVAFAGICLPSPETPSGINCVILTTAANRAVAPVHDRMPVALPLRLRDEWLAGGLGKADIARLAAATPWASHPVSSRVNSVRNNNSDLIRESTPQPDPQLRLL